MEILTLLRANIRRKKGTFISIMLLTAITVTLITATFSVRDNYDGALDNALEYADCGEINTYIKTEALSDELRQAVENNKLVDRVEYLSSLSTNGAAVGENHEENSYFIMESTEGIKLFNSDADALEESIPELKNGEIYLPLGLKSKLECNVGDTITLELIGDYSPEFKIKGFVQEPTCGALMMGIKYVYVSHGDFQKYYDLCKPLESQKKHIDFTVIRIHQAADSELSPAKFQRQLNMETKIVDNSTFALNSAQTLNYTTLLPDMLLDVVLAFAVLLFVTVLIVMSHSIATEIEIDYTTLGVLKSQGFTKGRIRAVIMLQYLIAEIIGIVFGCLAAIPLERLISGVFESVTAIFPDSGISVVMTLMFTAVIIAVSAILIFLKTRRIAKISPVRAISGGREEIYFSSRLNIPVSKKLLSATLSLRQFTSAKKRYIGAVFITAILTFCMITANLVRNMFSSRNALSMMGYTIADIKVTFGENECDFERVEEIINSHTKIEQKNSTIWRYTSLNGEQLQCVIYQFPEEINGILKGRAPIYDNEVIITEFVADSLGLKMGDSVTVSSAKKEADFIVSGIFQSTADTGMTFSMNFDAAENLGIGTDNKYRYYIIEDKSQANAIAGEIENEFGENISVSVYDEESDSEMQMYNTIILIMKILIYAFSLIFAFVVVRMVCTKTFIQERTDIGIFKAIGFTSERLRLGLAIRFLIVAVTGAVLGAILSAFLSEQILTQLFRLMGTSKVTLDFTAAAVLIPVAAISASFFAFAYLVSRRVKKVAVRELVTE